MFDMLPYRSCIRRIIVYCIPFTLLLESILPDKLPSQTKPFCQPGTNLSQWLFLVLLIGGRYHIIPPIGSIHHLYTTYSPCQLGDYMVPIPPIKINQETPLIESMIFLVSKGGICFLAPLEGAILHPPKTHGARNLKIPRQLKKKHSF